MKRFLLIDDHDIVRSCVKDFLEAVYKDCKIDEACGGNEAINQIENRFYDLVVMDIQMPKTDTAALLEFMLSKDPSVKILIFSMSAENIYGKRFLKAGAKGFISKEAPLDELMKAIETILNGKVYISEALAESLINDSFTRQPSNPFHKLSARELEITSLLLSGQTSTGITKSLKIQSSTVATHKARMFEKLGVNNILELNELAHTYDIALK